MTMPQTISHGSAGSPRRSHALRGRILRRVGMRRGAGLPAVLLAGAMLLIGTVGCGSGDGPRAETVAEWVAQLARKNRDAGADEDTSAPDEAPADRDAADGPDAATTDRAEFARSELELWSSPTFRRQLTQSYVAETEIEPRVSETEREQMLDILELIPDKMDEAVRELRKRRGEAASAVFDFTLGNIYFQREQLDEAADAYTVAVGKYPKFRRAWRSLGMIRFRQGRHDQALPALIRVIELGGGDALTYGLLGYCHSGVGDELAAESAYRRAILLDPATMDWRMGLARSLFRQERFAEAVALCGRLIEQEPENADLWLLQASAYVGMGKPLKAAENYELVDRLGKSSVNSLNMLGDIYVNEELFDLAVGCYVRALEKDDDADADRAVRAAKVLSARGATDETEKLITEIQRLRGDSLDVEDRKDLLKLQSRIAVARGAAEEEARVLEEIVSLDPQDGEALLLLGQHYARKGDPERAIFYFERAQSIEKYEADAKVRHAQVLVKGGDYAEALPLLRSAQTLKPRENVQQYLDQVERLAKAH